MKWITLILVLALFVCVSGVASATIYVPGNYTKIQWAVDNASAGSTIIVGNGTYVENVVVNKSITIVSANGTESTTVQAVNPDKHVFKVVADYVNISGFTVRGATSFTHAGIYISRAHCNISNNNCTNNDRGLYLSFARNNNITSNNCVQNSRYGIHIECGGNNSIISNNCTKNNCGIYIEESESNVITRNNCAFNAEGSISLDFSNRNRVSHNNCSSNEEYGIYPFKSMGSK